MNSSPLASRKLADYTSAAWILPHLQSRAIPTVIQELIQLLPPAERPGPDLWFSGMKALQHELLTSLTLDFGAVFPMVHSRTVQQPRLALGRAAEPLHWRAKIYPPIEFVFLMVGPNTSTQELRPLEETLHRLSSDHVRLGELALARNAEEMFTLLARIPVISANPPSLASRPHFGQVIDSRANPVSISP